MPLEIAPSLNASLNVMSNEGSRLSPQLKQFLLCDEFFSPQFPQVTKTETKAPPFLKGKKYDHLLFSYHGIPERHIRKSDVTKSHCKIDKSCCILHIMYRMTVILTKHLF